jgi:outer membrane protein assembly factor BamD
MVSRQFILLCMLAGMAAACAPGPHFGLEADPQSAFARCEQLFEKGENEQATLCFEDIRSRFTAGNTADEAEIRLGDIYFKEKNYLLAAETYRSFIQLHPTHRRLPYVYYRTGLSYLKESPKAIDRDQEYLEEAMGFFSVGLQYFSGSSYEEATREAWREARLRVAQRKLYIGRFYFKRKEYRAALHRLAQVSDNYTGLGLDEEALYLMAEAYVRLGERKKAFEVTAHLKKRHPDSKHLNQLIHSLDID